MLAVSNGAGIGKLTMMFARNPEIKVDDVSSFVSEIALRT